MMARKILSGITVGGLAVALVLLFAPTAQAHSFYGEGDCDGWTLHLDGTWGATDITVDGVSIGLEQNPTFPDDSDATSRTFTVVWVKQQPVTRTVTVERILDCESETTTTLPEETTTTTLQEETTTTLTETTTVPPGIASFVGVGNCDDEIGTITVDMGVGVSMVEVYVIHPDGVPTLEKTVAESGTFQASVGFTTDFLLIGYALPGFVFEDGEDSVTVTLVNCAEPTTTTIQVTTTEPEELPFTGPAGLIGLLIAGLVTVGIGTVLVREFGSE